MDRGGERSIVVKTSRIYGGFKSRGRALPFDRMVAASRVKTLGAGAALPSLAKISVDKRAAGAFACP